MCGSFPLKVLFVPPILAAGATLFNSYFQLTLGHPHYVIARAGAPAIVTIATNTAGRGTDIVVHPNSLKKGGLHLIFGFFPANDRVEQQGFGRAGRQGQQGSCRMILHSDKTYDELIQQRAYQIVEQSKTRISATERERVKHRYLAPFLSRLAHWRSTLNQKFLRSVRQRLELALAEGSHPKVGSELSPDEADLANAFHPEGGNHLLERFLEAVRQRLDDDILLLWGEKFYNELDHLVSEDYETAVEELYQTCKTELDRKLSNPQEGFYSAIQRLIGISLRNL